MKSIHGSVLMLFILAIGLVQVREQARAQVREGAEAEILKF
jgi:hypothetical protein